MRWKRDPCRAVVIIVFVVFILGCGDKGAGSPRGDASSQNPVTDDAAADSTGDHHGEAGSAGLGDASDIAASDAAAMEAGFGPMGLPPLAPVDVSGLPVDDAGRPVVFDDGMGTQLVLERSTGTPVTTLARCSRLVNQCWEPPARSLDACWQAVRKCTTEEPWSEPYCCPTECYDSYQRQRARGMGEGDALSLAFFGKPSCVPGLDVAVGEGAP